MKKDVPEAIKLKIEQFTAFQKAYCEFRAQGLPQALAAKKAGSNGQDNASLARIGYQVEQTDGAKEYIDWIKNSRLEGSLVDEVEVISMLYKVYSLAIEGGEKKYLKDANTAAQLIGQALGMFGKSGGITIKGKQTTDTTKESVDTSAFQEEEAEIELDAAKRAKKLLALIEGDK